MLIGLQYNDENSEVILVDAYKMLSMSGWLVWNNIIKIGD